MGRGMGRERERGGGGRGKSIKKGEEIKQKRDQAR